MSANGGKPVSRLRLDSSPKRTHSHVIAGNDPLGAGD